MVFLFLRQGLAKTHINLNQFLSIYLSVLIGLLFIFMGLSGRLHWLFVLFGGLMPLLSFTARNALGLFRVFSLIKGFTSWHPFSQTMSRWRTRNKGNNKPQIKTSKIDTAFLMMTLNHETGDLDGKVIKGHFIKNLLSQLSYKELKMLLEECKQDAESISLLQAYLERNYPDEDPHSTEGYAEANNGSDLDKKQALAILGLEDDAQEEEIVAAHRRLIQKMHPDRGGSTYLAARINEAKTMLLDKGPKK